MKRRIALAMLGALLPLWAAAQVAVPADLEGWRGWALDGQEFRRCPLFVNADPNDAQERVCAWPARLSLDLAAGGGHFSQSWQVFSESWVPLPGNLEHWPREVRVDGRDAAVVAHEGIPQLRLAAGTHAISGSFAWERRPESLSIPARSGLVSLRLDGREIAQADRPDGAVWLGKRRDAEQVQGIDVQVYRLLADGLPALLTTQLRLQVSGDAREELLSTVLPAGFTPMALSSALPARIDADGRLRVQARAGNWEITLLARGRDSAQTITLPAVKGLWPKQEIWGYAADDRLRVAAVEGAVGIDPAQANVPPAWRQYPSFRVLPGASLQVVERSRGLSAQDGNRLTLQRQLYLDFDHGGYTIADRINGRMRTQWRLDMSRPYRLASASKDGESLLVTEGASAGLSGVELRSPQVSLSTLGRLDAGTGRMPATGWVERFDHVSGLLNLPPGHRLLAALGADAAPQAWVERWGLMDLFLLLITAAIALRLRGALFAAATLAAVALVHQEDARIVWLLLAVMIALVSLRVAPAGWPRTVLSWMRTALLGLLLLVLVPFAVSQIRFALYPQLADTGGAIYEPAVLEETAPAAAAADANTELQEVSVTGARRNRAAPPSVQLDNPPPPPPELAREDAVAAPAASAVVDNPYGLKASASLQRYAPGTLVQAGPGRPHWNFVSYAYAWNGPVEASESVHFLILNAGWVAVWRLLGVALLAWVFALLIRSSTDLRDQWRGLLPPRAAAAAAVLLLGGIASRADAAATPSSDLLNELRARLTRAPQCLPSCVDILSAQVTLTPGSLDAQLEVSALTSVAVALPAAANRFEPDTVSVDGAAVAGVYRDPAQQYWIALQPGVHKVRVAGRLPPAESIQVVFPQVPHNIAVNGSGWDVNGVNAGRLLANTLELVRRKAAADSTDTDTAAQFAPFVRLHRQIQLDLDWSMSTRIERLAPQKGGFSLQVPLLAGESVLTPGIESRDGKGVLVGFDSNATTFSWQSGLARVDSLTLTAPKDAPWVEVWSFNVSPMWRATFSGLPAVMPAPLDAANWIFEYHPRPGERLTVAVARPAAAQGGSLAIDNVELNATAGKRVTESTLALSYRSTQGGRHTLKLPATARVSEVNVDGSSVPVRPENGELPLAVLPGAHRVQIHWQSDDGVAWRTRSPEVDLRNAASNITTVLRLPLDRWVLFAGGRGVGPAILYWGELLVFIVFAVLLARSGRSPLKMHEWLLLGLGLSTFSWAVLMLFALWQFAMRWRGQLDTAALSRRRFNVLQVGLIALSVIALFSLIAAIPNGLLATPDMRIAGAGQSAAQLAWFNDQLDGSVPAVWVLSVSLWWYKLAMLLWALWLAFALVRWLPAAWQALNAGEWWRRAAANPVQPDASPPT